MFKNFTIYISLFVSLTAALDYANLGSLTEETILGGTNFCGLSNTDMTQPVGLYPAVDQCCKTHRYCRDQMDKTFGNLTNIRDFQMYLNLH